MRKLLVFTVLNLALFTTVFAQGVNIEDFNQDKTAITVGLLNGGGLIGAEVETLISSRIGAHIGVGFIGFCAGFDYHFKPTINSSSITLQLRNQGFGEIHTDTSLGLGVTFRKYHLALQIGAAYKLKQGPNTIENWNTSTIIPQISFGYFSPF